MDSDVETLVWKRASQVYADSLSLILSKALLGYKRTSGFDDLTRLHEATLGGETMMILRHAIKLRWPASDVGYSDPYVELRSRLRSYLTQYLLRKLVFDHEDTPALRDAFFAGDLGM
ncbi:hypothetical protein [Pseudomonas sp. 2822-17]|uniref:hypothetical protein n=1 Tax=Pseudomonas sp. 2822-17 TaxID=1712678 RepID=UPI000C155D21|nr:hypothetical protein [Pseudomonas sp. 2822-17]PIB53736.1 hypothetical protein AOA60_22020 [Pseudomonas sp. 2822-17]